MAKNKEYQWIYNTSCCIFLGLYFLIGMNVHVSAEAGKTQATNCHFNPCKNSGSCYIVSDSVRTNNCPEGFTYYKDHCYRVIPGSPLSWFDARNECQAHQATLISVETMVEKDFIGILTQGSQDGTKFWTSGVHDPRSRMYIWDSTGQIINWQGEREPRDFKAQRRGDPQICLAISKTKHNSYWLPDNCQTAKNNFICEMTAPPKNETGFLSYLYQCRCPARYYGFNCEHKHPTEDFNFITCENQRAEMKCPNHLSLVIEFASYGFLAPNSKCQKEVDEINCTMPNTLTVIRQRCQGQHHCLLPQMKLILEDPCIGTFNSFEFRIQCKEGVTNCPNGSFFHNGSCYEPNPKNSIIVDHSEHSEEVILKSWTEARAHCQDQGGDLASISTDTVNEFLGKILYENTQFWVGFRNTPSSPAIPPRWTNEDDFILPSYLNVTGCLDVKLMDLKLHWNMADCNKNQGWICRYPPFAEKLPRQIVYIDPIMSTITSNAITITEQGGNVSKESISPRSEIALTTTAIVSVSQELGYQNITTQRSLVSTTPHNTINFSTVVFPDQSSTTFTSETPKPDITKPLVSTTAIESTSSDSQSISGKTEGYVTTSTISSKFCEAALGWAKTQVREIATRQCPFGTGLDGNISPHQEEFLLMYMTKNQMDNFLKKYSKGFAFWKCEDSLTFSKIGPNYILCYSGWEDELMHRLNDTNAPATHIISYLSALTNDSDHMTTKNLNLVVNIFSTLISKHQYQLKFMNQAEAQIASTDFTKEMVQTSSNLLQPYNSKTWNELSEHESVPLANKLLKAMDQSAFITSDYIRMKTLFQSEYLSLKVDVRNATDGALSYYDVTNPNNFIAIPSEAFSQAEKNGQVKIVFSVYNTIANLLPVYGQFVNHSENTTVNSKVLSLALQDSETSFSFKKDKVIITVEHLNESDNKPICVFWNFSAGLHGSWDTRGCAYKSKNRTHTQCECDHLTNFAVLMDITGILSEVNESQKKILGLITMVGCIISIVCLLISFIIFTVFRQLWCDRNTVHRHLCLCLLIAQIVLLVGLEETANKMTCAIIAGILHYFFLASFVWMCLEGLQLYIMLIKVFEAEKSSCLWYLLAGYGLPALVVGITAGVRPDGYGTKNYCWLKPDDTIWSFTGPILLVIVINIVFLTIALRIVFRVKTAREQTKAAKAKGWMKGSAMLLCLLGVTWIFGYFSITKGTLSFAYIFTVLNSLQGFFIFIFHCMMNEKVQKAWRRFIRKSKLCPRCLKTHYGEQTTTTFHSSTGTSSRNGTVTSRLSTILNTIARKRKPSKPASVCLDTTSKKKLMKNTGYTRENNTVHNNGATDSLRLQVNGNLLNRDLNTPDQKSDEYLPQTTHSEGNFSPVKSNDYLPRHALSEGHIHPTVTSESNVSSTTEDSAQL